MPKALVVATVLVLLGRTEAVRAEVTPVNCDDAARLRDRGKVAFDHRDYAVALEYFENAYRLCPTPKWKFNIALALDSLGREPEALEAYEAALADGQDADTDTRAYARDRVAVLEKEVGTLTITSRSGATIAIDGKPRGTIPLGRPLRVRPGRHQVAATLKGYETNAVEMHVNAGETVPVALELRPIDLGATKPTGPSFSSRHKWSLIAAGTAAALAVAGVGFGYWTYRSYADLSSTCAGLPPSGCPEDGISSVETKALVTNLLFGAAGVAAITSAVLFFVFETEPTRPSDIAIVPTSSGAALIVRY